MKNEQTVEHKHISEQIPPKIEINRTDGRIDSGVGIPNININEGVGNKYDFSPMDCVGTDKANGVEFSSDRCMHCALEWEVHAPLEGKILVEHTDAATCSAQDWNRGINSATGIYSVLAWWEMLERRSVSNTAHIIDAGVHPLDGGESGQHATEPQARLKGIGSSCFCPELVGLKDIRMLGHIKVVQKGTCPNLVNHTWADTPACTQYRGVGRIGFSDSRGVPASRAQDGLEQGKFLVVSFFLKLAGKSSSVPILEALLEAAPVPMCSGRLPKNDSCRVLNSYYKW